MSAAPTVEIGQVWAGTDKRSAGRHVKVIAVGPARARVARCDPSGQVHEPPRVTGILLTRFRPGSRGFRLVIDADGAPVGGAR